MKNKILKITLVIAIILVIIAAIRMLKSTNRGTPNQSQKGSPVAFIPEFTNPAHLV